MLKKLFSYFKGYYKFLIIGPTAVLIDVAAELAIPLLMARIVDVGVATYDIGYIAKTGLLMILLALVAIGAGSCNIICSSRAAQGAAAALRQDMFSRIQSFSFTNIDRFSTASLVTRMTNDVNQLQNTAIMSLRLLVRAPLMMICAVVVAVSINARLASILLVAAPLLINTIALIWSRVNQRFTLMQQKLDDVNAAVQENLIAIRVIKSFVRERREQQKFATVNDAYLHAGLNAVRLVILMMPLMMLLMNGSILAVIWFGGGMVNQGLIGTGLLMSFFSYIMQILMSLMMCAMVLIMAARARASGHRVVEVLETEPTIKDAPASARAAFGGSMGGGVEFSRVSFKYNEEQSEPVLTDISFSIAPGQMAALVGGTGSGKSSLVQLIPRLYDVSAGRISVGGRDVREWPLTQLRENVAMVLQSSRLFSGAIRDNLLWGYPQATQEEIEHAARIAQAHEFILALPDGYDTQLGQGGVNLSGGQKQRLCIARAILKKPAVLILDDSTSAVDSDTEAKLRRAFYEELPGVTVLMIAQRISSVAQADTILVLQEGHLAGMGNHKQLMESNQVYREIYYSQQDAVEGAGIAHE
ncbi:MAG: ABC transporter ATP-binding protein/permease [Clostridiales bacterium]|nr:ABC transporter ATP-binding protein/permease [Clostridiales bacterium]